MRPVTKGAALHYQDGQDHDRARAGLVGRLGFYCSYCERQLVTSLQVEHILAVKNGGPNSWTNFLLACPNCNPTKGKRDGGYAAWLIPDRDNTAAAFLYQEDGLISLRNLSPAVLPMARVTLELLKLNKKVTSKLDDAKNKIALDRRTQRLEAWVKAKLYRSRWEKLSTLEYEDAIVDIALESGHFSIWMEAFAGVPSMRNRFIKGFKGTEAGCFDPVTTEPIFPHPNTDQLEAGGKL